MALELAFASSGPAAALPIQPNQLQRLLYKYRTLAGLRRDRANGLPLPPRKIFQELAKEFPGSLAELDRLQLDEIDRRIQQIEFSLQTGEARRWMSILHAYHALMRAALYIKSKTTAKSLLSQEEAFFLAERAAPFAEGLESTVGAAFAQAVQHPPQGRINTIVFEQLSIFFDEPADKLRDILFINASETA